MQGVFHQLQLKSVLTEGAVCCSIKIQRQLQTLADSRIEIKLLQLLSATKLLGESNCNAC